MTILDALAWGTEKIRNTLHEKRTTVHVPSYDAQLLLAHVLTVRTSFLFAHGNDTLSDDAWNQFRGMILRRTHHEPVAHIIGTAHFFGRSFLVNRHVLTPRPETEELIELVLKQAMPTSTYIDVGTGSGAIAITLALETEKSVYATDIDTHALKIANWNAEALHAKVNFFEGSLLEEIPSEIKHQPYVTYVANLPYIPTGARKEIDPDVLEYEPHHALFSGIDGLELSMNLLHQLPQKHPFALFMELDRSNIVSFAKLTQNIFPEAEVEIITDTAKQPRFLKAITKPR